MNYIIYVKEQNLFSVPIYRYERYELKSDEELKQFLFDRQHNLKNIEIFNTSHKCEINFEVFIKGGKKKHK